MSAIWGEVRRFYLPDPPPSPLPYLSRSLLNNGSPVGLWLFGLCRR